jgi:glycosyltransferase involved in cell wall biosynthesis
MVVTRADWGGAQRHVFDLATKIDPTRFRVTVACSPDGPLVQRLSEAGVAVRSLTMLRREISPWHDLMAVRALTDLVRETEADLVHAHSSKAGILGRLAARRAKVPAFFTAHGFAFAGSRTPMAFRILYLISEWWAGRRWTDRLITVSASDRRLALAWRIAKPERVALVYNGINHHRFAAVPPPTAGPIPVIGVLTRLVPGKGLDDLLQAAQLLLTTGPYRFVIGGDGPLLERLKLRAQSLGIAEQVEFLGFVTDEVAFLRQIDVYVLPSYKEGLPYGVLEAIAAGRPVVATAVGGLPEVVTDGVNGRLVVPGNVSALANALREVTEERQLRHMSENARQLVTARFTLDRMIRQVEQLYMNALDTHQGHGVAEVEIC